MHGGGGVGDYNDPDGHDQDKAGDAIEHIKRQVQRDFELLLPDAAGGRHRKFLQLPHSQAGVCRADDRRAVSGLRGG